LTSVPRTPSSVCADTPQTNPLAYARGSENVLLPSRGREGAALRWRILAAASLFAFFWWLSPPDQPSFHLCPFYWLTARPCPLCGITRAFCALAKGHWTQAIHFHALSPLAFVMLFSLFWKFRWRAPFWTWGLAAIGTYGVWRAAGMWDML
jgi:hypothetical protein